MSFHSNKYLTELGTIDSLFMGILGCDKKHWENTTDCSKSRSFCLFDKFLFNWSDLLMNIYVGHSYLLILCLFGEVYTQTSSPDIFCSYFSIMLFQVLDWLSQSLGRAWVIFVISPSKWNVQPCVPPKALLPVKIPSPLSQNGVIKSAAVHFWAVPAECTEPEVTQALGFSSSVKSS